MILKKLKEHLDKKLPFVAYRKSNAISVNVIFQNDDRLHTVSDFTESGFIFAPFDATQKAILLPFDETFEGEITNFESANIINEIYDPSAEAKKKYEQLVQKAIETIQDSEIEKIVVSRKEEIDSKKDSFLLFQQLLINYPTAFVYIWFHPKVGFWAGATPETLVSAKGNTITTMSLAGTRKFQENVAVSWNQKELEEQQIVTDYIKNSLLDLTTNLVVSEAETHQAGSLLHLCSMISGRMTTTVNIGDIITNLHPTPAICGFPTEAAKTFILAEEKYDRKFYAGYLGELNKREETTRNRNRKNQENSAYRTVRSNSELYVNLRCMELTDDKRILYIGGGITKDSNPESEWQETVAKSQIMKRVL
ncbi:Putative isochorismate synthase MenF [Kordia antarctica]|uniref:Isochorismate synthase MenF n=1 Tax=Kordia antarctica TaxID=1218801 RepID=A0A7L4ZI15_9FLAO|nr:chorismate-binding protein [Kordia antarctica]QHI35856.1 Putative isochorismate synthase MenF [Kordia antarctica]